jgi:hypothetical protein
MDSHNVYLVNRRLERVDAGELDRVREFLDPLPEGYAEMLSILGFGTYCDFVTLWRHREIATDLESVREAVKVSLGWYSPDSIPDADFDRCVPLAMTLDGDYLVVCPDRLGEVFAIPRHDDSVYRLPQGLRDPMDWKRCDASRRGGYVCPPPFRYFESFVGRCNVSLFTGDRFKLTEIAEWFKTQLAGEEIRSICDDGCTILFPRAIDGRVQLTQTLGDPRVGIDVRFDRDAAAIVESLVTDLERQGFYVTSRT